MRFLRPDYTEWLLLLPLLVALWLVNRWSRAAFRRRLDIAPRFSALSRPTTLRRDLAVLAAALLGSGSLVFALMRPQAPIARTEPEYARQDLVVILDRSVSMNARDIQPSRASRATRELRNLIRMKPPGLGRIALVGFADSAVILSYLTDDANSLLFYLDWIDKDQTPLLGTNIGDALRSGLTVVRKDRRETAKTFLLISDGEDHSGELKAALQELATAGYHVNSVGVGGSDAVPIPIRTQEGAMEYLRDDAGRPLTTRFSEETLRHVAAVTGGTYVRSTTGEQLSAALGSLLAGDRRVIGWHETTEYRDLYLVGLAMAALAATGLWLLT